MGEYVADVENLLQKRTLWRFFSFVYIIKGRHERLWPCDMAPSDVWKSDKDLIYWGNLIEIFLRGLGPGPVAISIYSFGVDNERVSDIDVPYFHNVTCK